MRRWQMIAGLVVLGFGVAVLLMRGFNRPSQAFVSTPSCKQATANAQGVASADVVVTIAATPVIAADTSLCGGIITNTSALDAVRCSQAHITPTSTTQFKLLPFQVWALDQEVQRGITCIRDDAATGDVALTVLELRP